MSGLWLFMLITPWHGLIEVWLFWISVALGFFLKKPLGRFSKFSVVSSLQGRAVVILPSMLGSPPRTPLPIDFTASQKTSPRS